MDMSASHSLNLLTDMMDGVPEFRIKSTYVIQCMKLINIRLSLIPTLTPDQVEFRTAIQDWTTGLQEQYANVSLLPRMKSIIEKVRPDKPSAPDSVLLTEAFLKEYADCQVQIQAAMVASLKSKVAQKRAYELHNKICPCGYFPKCQVRF